MGSEKGRGWPPECLEAAERFGKPHARLYPLADPYGKGPDVTTTEGDGKLLQVFEDRAMVLLFSTRKKKRRVGQKTVEYRPATFLHWADVVPYGQEIL